MSPVEFIVAGTPKSVQSNRKDRWKKKVADAARAARPAGSSPEPRPVRVRLVFCFEKTNLDADNIVKPILDALDDADLFLSDSQVADLTVSLRNFAEAARLRDPPPALTAALATMTGDFVFVSVALADLKNLP